MVGMGLVAGWLGVEPALRNLSPVQYGETVWRFDGVLFLLWALSVPLGSILACVGVLLYVGTRGVSIWLFGMGVFLVLILVETLLPSRHFPPLFGVGGGLILAFFLGILWFWARTRKLLVGAAGRAADYQLAGYVFLLITAWFLCKAHGTPYMKALEDQPLESPSSVMVYLVLGWLFLFLGHYRLARTAGVGAA
jgi:hypothetical protein